MTRAEIQAYFPPPGVPAYCGQADYEVPDFDWLRGEFYESFHAELWGADLDKWHPRWVCEYFAAEYRLRMQRAWAKAAGIENPARGVAVGEIHYLPTPEILGSDGHAICPLWRGDELVFIDPQTNQLCALTPAQFASRSFLRF